MERSQHLPLFKKRSINKSENYRPVSLTSVICKLLERLIKDHLVDFLVKNKLINPSQHGFLKARSCLTNMLCFLEDVTKWLDEGSPVDIIYLDLKKKPFTKCHTKDYYYWHRKWNDQLDRKMAY